MRKNQKGFTIVELLIAITILSIVVAVVCGFILVGSRSYAAGNSDINIQQEAQLALNQMSDVMIDTTRSVNYVGYDAAGNPEHALKDAEFPFTPEDKSLILFNGVVVKDPSGGADTMEEGNGNKHYHFYWNKTQETLFYAEQDVSSLAVESVDIMNSFPPVSDADPDADPASTRWYVLAQHVVDFSADLSQLEEKRVVQLALTFVDGRKEYVTSNNVTIRNKVGVNDAEIAPLNRKVEIDIVVKPSVILEPGETFVLPTPTVTGKNVTDKSVTWSFVDTPSDDGEPVNEVKPPTTLTTDGILKLSEKAKGSFRVRATTNAKDSDNNSKSADITVNVKRVLDITMSGPSEVSPGSTFTISAKATGDFLDQPCDACGEDTSIDRHILSTNNKPGIDGGNRVWRVWDPHLEGEEWYIQNDPSLEDWHPMEHIDLISQDEYSATFYIKPNVEHLGEHVYVIQAVSLLSFYRPYGSPTYKGRFYNWVMKDFSLNVVKSEAKPIKGLLQYGDETLIDEIKEDLTTEGHEYVTCIRVVDNSPVDPQPDKILLYFTIGHGANFRIVPDLFDLDLSRSYTFYMQALDPVSKENHKQGNHHQADSKQEIWNEYINHLNPRKPYGYVGDKYDYRDVYYSVLDKPRAIWNGYEKGKDITFDPVNVYAGNTIIGSVEPDSYENIWDTARTRNRMTYSVYVGDGDKKDDWTPLYWYNGETMSYEGSTSVADGAGKLMIQDKPGRPANPSEFFVVQNGNEKKKLCGNYHIVTGFCYENVSDRTLTGDYDIIGWRGFSCDGKAEFTLPHDLRHYTFDNGTIHVNIGAFFNLELWSYYNNQFTKGEIYFPTPSETKFTSYFNRENLEWQNAKQLDWFVKSINGSDTTTYYTPSSMRCRYVADRKIYELELFYSYDSGWGQSVEVSAGIFQCAADGSRWERKERGPYDSLLEQNKKPQVDGSTADMDCTLWGSAYKGKIYIPLPSESAFVGLGFERNKEAEQIKEGFRLKYQPEGSQDIWDLWNMKLKCTYNAAQDEYTIELFDSNWSYAAKFTCKSDGERWTQQ